jgi:hypothetical protein
MLERERERREASLREGGRKRGLNDACEKETSGLVLSAIVVRIAAGKRLQGMTN